MEVVALVLHAPAGFFGFTHMHISCVMVTIRPQRSRLTFVMFRTLSSFTTVLTYVGLS